MDRALAVVRPLTDGLDSLHHRAPSSDQRMVRNADTFSPPGLRIDGPFMGKDHQCLGRRLRSGKEHVKDARLDQVIGIRPGHPRRLPLLESHGAPLSDMTRNSGTDKQIDGLALQLLDDARRRSVVRQDQYVEVDEMGHRISGDDCTWPRSGGPYLKTPATTSTRPFARQPRTADAYSKLPTESRARLSKRVYSPKNFSFTVPVAPLRCLLMITSASPLSVLSLW